MKEGLEEMPPPCTPSSPVYVKCGSAGPCLLSLMLEGTPELEFRAVRDLRGVSFAVLGNTIFGSRHIASI